MVIITEPNKIHFVNTYIFLHLMDKAFGSLTYKL